MLAHPVLPVLDRFPKGATKSDSISSLSLSPLPNSLLLPFQTLSQVFQGFRDINQKSLWSGFCLVVLSLSEQPPAEASRERDDFIFHHPHRISFTQIRPPRAARELRVDGAIPPPKEGRVLHSCIKMLSTSFPLLLVLPKKYSPARFPSFSERVMHEYYWLCVQCSMRGVSSPSLSLLLSLVRAYFEALWR